MERAVLIRIESIKSGFMPSTFYILNSFLLPTGYNHMFFAQKVANGFKYNGFNVKIIRHIRDITDPGFVLICDHPVYYSFGARDNKNGNIMRAIPWAINHIDKYGFIMALSNMLRHRALRSLQSQIKDKRIVVIGWFVQGDKDFFDKLGMKIIFTGEYFTGKPRWRQQLLWYKFYTNKKVKNVLPLRHSADVDPNRIGEHCKNDKYIASYVGDKSYIRPYMDLFQGDNKYKIVPTPPYITEGKKRAIYQNSAIIMGLNSEQNIKNKMVAERIFEAMAYGAVCLTNNPAALMVTNRCAILINKKQDFKAQIIRLSNNKRKMALLRKKGLKFIKMHGTWHIRAREVIRLSNKLYGVGL